MNSYAAAVAIALLAAPGATAQRREPVLVADPSSVVLDDVKEMRVSVPDCQAWEADRMALGCAFVARPPEICIFTTPAKRMFALLDAALASTRGEAPPPSRFFQATVIMRLKGGRVLEAEVPLYPSLEKEDGRELWGRYGERRIQLTRAAWDEIAALAQSPDCVKQPRRWGFK